MGSDRILYELTLLDIVKFVAIGAFVTFMFCMPFIGMFEAREVEDEMRDGICTERTMSFPLVDPDLVKRCRVILGTDK